MVPDEHLMGLRLCHIIFFKISFYLNTETIFFNFLFLMLIYQNNKTNVNLTCFQANSTFFKMSKKISKNYAKHPVTHKTTTLVTHTDSF